MKTLKIFIYTLLTMSASTLSFAGSLGDEPSISQAMGGINALQAIVAFVFGLAAITSIIFLIVNITKLGAAGDNDRARSEAVKAIFISGFCLAAFGGLSIIVAVLGGFFGDGWFGF